MGEKTGVSWTDHTYNAWWGCTRVSPACDHCYAETFAKRTGHDLWGKTAPRRFFGDKHWAEPLKWDRRAADAGVRRRVFCSSMADVFEARDDLVPERERLWDLISRTPNLDWLLLTKRPENVLRMVPDHWRRPAVMEGEPTSLFAVRGRTSTTHPCWPTNAWIGTTVEDQHFADLRVPRLLTVPAPVRFLSCEPLLGPINLRPWMARLGWVIVGGESGPHRRPFNVDDARDLRNQCAVFGVPFFFKQDAGLYPGTAGPADLEAFKEFPA